jgi:hypothetical protein
LPRCGDLDGHASVKQQGGIMVECARNERGLALLVSILGLVVVGTVVSAFAFSGVLERRESNSTRRATQAFAVAEYGVGETIGNWSSSLYNTMAVGSSVSVSGTTPGGSGTYAGTVQRLNNELFLVDMTGQDAAIGARQNIAAIVKLRTIKMDIHAALTTQGPTLVGGTAQIYGTNVDPSGWAGCAGAPDLAGVRILPGDLDGEGGCADPGYACIDGSPQVNQDPTIDSTTFFSFGDTDWNDLVALADKVLPPGTYTQTYARYSGGNCDTAHPLNWGDPITPTSACGNYFPVIYITGNAEINSHGYGQGILLIEGDAYVRGGFEFYGVVVVRGNLKTDGTGGHFNGAVLAGNTGGGNQWVKGNATVQYSSCAIARALNNAAPGTMLESRGWLYSY